MWTHLLAVFLLIGFFVDIIIEKLNISAAGSELPNEFAGIYSAEKYKKSQEYLRENSSFGFWQSAFSLLLLLIAIYFSIFNWWDLIIRQWVDNEIWQGLLFFAGFGGVSWVLSIPFSYHHTFGIETKYGFNKSTLKIFVKDQFIAVILGVILGGCLLSLIFWFFGSLPKTGWLWAWLALSGFQIFLSFLAPVLILPLFNKFIPLEDGELKTKIQEYAKSQNFELKGIFTMDGSKRSTKANAFFTGFGRFRRVVLFDTLVEKQSPDELLAVLAHEIGHFKRKHIIKQTLLSLFSSGLMLFLLGKFIHHPILHQAFNMDNSSIYSSLLFFAIIYSPVSQLINLYSLYLSRKYEFEADEFAAQTSKKPEDLVSALKKLSVDNLSNLTPHPFKVFWSYTHPPVLERINALRKL